MPRFPRWVAWMEKVCSAWPPLAELYSRPYLETLRRELDMAGVNGDDILLQVGCGAVPFSAIWAARHCGCRVWALDLDEKAVVKAQSLVRRLGLDDRIRVLHRDASREVPSGFTVALLSLQAAPKEDILRCLARAEPRARLVARQPREGLENLYGAVPREWPVQDEVEQSMGTFRRSLLLVPAARALPVAGREALAS